MSNIDDMTLEEIDATLAQLRDRRRIIKKTGKVVDKKVATLEKRRNKFMQQVQTITEQIEALRRDASTMSVEPQRRRGRKPKSSLVAAE